MAKDPSNLAIDARSILKRQSEVLNEHLSQVRARCPGAPARLLDAIDYSLLGGGKRLRPALVLQCYRACVAKNPPLQGRGSADDHNSSAIACAIAMELIHTFSLIHDDLPAMDDDDLRRGRATNHKVFGEAMAILAGDAMMTLAFQIIATDAEPDLAPLLIAELAKCAGAAGMIGGQALDIQNENHALNLEKLQQIHRLKTGALLTCSCRLGAICAGARSELLAAMTAFGQHLGLAFQIVDDLLDVTATAQQLGKQTHKDINLGKNTYPALLGLDKARVAADAELGAALHALSPLGDSAAQLAALARFVVEREN